MKLLNTEILSEVYDEYRELREEGQSRDDATKVLKHRYHNELHSGKIDDGVLFWIRLADAQYKYQEISSEVAENAIKSLDLLEHTFPGIPSRDIATRRKHYEQAPMPEKSVVRKRKKYCCAWKVGDVFSYTLISDEADKKGIKGGQILYQKIDELEIYDGSIVPIVTMTYLEPNVVPFNLETFLNTRPLRMANGRFGTDPNKFEYRAQLLIDNRQQLARSSLQYLGNYPVKKAPEDEIIFRISGNMMMIPIKRLEMYGCAFWNVDNYFRHI